jgi:hypothetical protein
LTFGLVASPAPAAPKKASAAKGAKKAPKPPPKKKVAPPNAEKKKKLAELYAGFKFGQTKDEVLGVLTKQVNESYEEKIAATTDIAAKDRIRKDRKAEIARINATYVAFDLNKPSPWDVSIVEEELAHGTGESMMERWENQGGKNNRRFFFFYEGKLYKMFISLDVSILPEDKRNFETFQGVMLSQYGPGDVGGGIITWNAGEFQVRAIDKLKSYGALALVIEEPRVTKEVVATRIEKAPPKKETNSIIKAVIDVDNTDKPDVKSNSNAVDEVIKAQGGGGKR